MAKEYPLESKGFHPFGELIGLKFCRSQDDSSQCSLEMTDELLNPHKVLHGGVIYSMADTGMGFAIYPSLAEKELCATVEIKINYFRAVTFGTLFCSSRVVHKGKRIVALESEITNNGRLVAKALGTYSIFTV
ncbi:MAG: PaaI family thioesterase [Proteobacteria bacterium]|nr:PaaI family thioesterase [Pseudomonadota bacterium]